MMIIDRTRWQYHETDHVWYQLGIPYCDDPADLRYETLAVFVPEEYMQGEKNEEGYYTCTFGEDTVNGFSYRTAPIVIPVRTPGYASMEALTEYVDVTKYTNAGYVYVHAGCRGREEGAPAGITDLKAAVRYLRYTQETLPGSTGHIFTFGMSGGGAQSALMGASGDDPAYSPYLAEIGAVQGYSDAVYGAMCWCPIIALDRASASYEWMMGGTRKDLTEEDKQISKKLAEAFAQSVNTAGIKDENGKILTLEESDDGRYQAGSYYAWMKRYIEISLEHFMEDTVFPYNAGNDTRGRMLREPGPRDGIIRKKPESSALQLTGTYETPEDYIQALNEREKWVLYDPDTHRAHVTSIEAFARNLKPANKALGAFDQLDRGQKENELFGYNDGQGAHFDALLGHVLQELGHPLAEEYAKDLERRDLCGNTPEERVNMYTPTYLIGEGKSHTAPYWRIRTGISQSDTALCTEAELYLALKNTPAVKDADFAAVWGLKHVKAERTGDSDENFIAWVKHCMCE